MKETNTNMEYDNDGWKFTQPREIEDEEDQDKREQKICNELEKMTNEEFAQFCFEMRLALYQEEIRRFGEYETKPNMSNNY